MGSGGKWDNETATLGNPEFVWLSVERDRRDPGPGIECMTNRRKLPSMNQIRPRPWQLMQVAVSGSSKVAKHST